MANKKNIWFACLRFAIDKSLFDTKKQVRHDRNAENQWNAD